MKESNTEGIGTAGIRIGTAPDSWGIWFPQNDLQMPWQRVMDEMACAGYRGVELGPWGYFPNNSDRLKEELTARGLSLVAVTAGADFSDDISVNALLKNIDNAAALAKCFAEAKYVVLLPEMYTDLMSGNQTMPLKLSADQWRKTYANLQRTHAYIRDHWGLVAVLHPHVECHIETEEEIERILENTDIQLCLDTGHHVYAGGEPISFYEKYCDRIPYVHLKDCDTAVRKMMNEKRWSFAEAVRHGIMSEPGSGGIDFRKFFALLYKKGYEGWAVVEQDLYPVDFDRPLIIAKRTYNYLKGCL